MDVFKYFTGGKPDKKEQKNILTPLQLFFSCQVGKAQFSSAVCLSDSFPWTVSPELGPLTLIGVHPLSYPADTTDSRLCCVTDVTERTLRE